MGENALKPLVANFERLGSSANLFGTNFVLLNINNFVSCLKYECFRFMVQCLEFILNKE